jgi:hypothetical protein
MATSSNRGAYLSFVGLALGALGAVLVTAGNTVVGVAIMAIGAVLVAAGGAIDRKSLPPSDKK